MSSYTQPCEYPECQCTVSGAIAGAAYCSEVCESRDTADEQADTACACAHPPCDAAD